MRPRNDKWHWWDGAVGLLAIAGALLIGFAGEIKDLLFEHGRKVQEAHPKYNKGESGAAEFGE